MAKPEGTVEINVFVSPELRDAVQRKCKAMGTNVSFVVRQFLEEWAAQPAPARLEQRYIVKPPTPISADMPAKQQSKRKRG